MAEIAPDWSVELQGICAEEATLVLMPDGGDDANGPSFVISQETFGFRMDQVHWDTTDGGRVLHPCTSLQRLRLTAIRS